MRSARRWCGDLSGTPGGRQSAIRRRSVIIGFVVALALSATAGYAVQEFTLDEARTRIERLEARVASLEATMAAGGDTSEESEAHTITGIVVIESSSHWGREGH